MGVGRQWRTFGGQSLQFWCLGLILMLLNSMAFLVIFLHSIVYSYDYFFGCSSSALTVERSARWSITLRLTSVTCTWRTGHTSARCALMWPTLPRVPWRNTWLKCTMSQANEVHPGMLWFSAANDLNHLVFHRSKWWLWVSLFVVLRGCCPVLDGPWHKLLASLWLKF